LQRPILSSQPLRRLRIAGYQSGLKKQFFNLAKNLITLALIATARLYAIYHPIDLPKQVIFPAAEMTKPFLLNTLSQFVL
jgi:hypothetical protein